MREIQITKGYVAIVDDVLFDELNQLSWAYSTGYAYRLTKHRGKGEMMHRRIMNAPKGIEVDHKNGNRLDNRIENLRLATRRQNAANRNRAMGASGYKGVSLQPGMNKWRAYITVDYKYIHLGLFDHVLAAAQAYNNAAIKYFGEFAKLNEL